jgi:hypothetical protein
MKKEAIPVEFCLMLICFVSPNSLFSNSIEFIQIVCGTTELENPKIGNHFPSQIILGSISASPKVFFILTRQKLHL